MAKLTSKKNLFVQITLISTLISFTFSQLLYSILGLVTETSFQIKAKSADGLPIKLFLNNQLVQTINSFSDNGYYYEYTHNTLTNNTSYIVELEYSGSRQALQKKSFKTPNFGNSNYTFGIMSSQSKPDDSLSYLRLWNRTTDAVLFLGGLSNDYYDEITQSELLTVYKEGKTLHIINL
jgi:hypothetical protein